LKKRVVLALSVPIFVETYISHSIQAIPLIYVYWSELAIGIGRILPSETAEAMSAGQAHLTNLTLGPKF
jgi:hypothetical protein